MLRSYLPSEADEQQALVNWCRAHGIALFSVPNGMNLHGGSRFGAVARAKQTGLLPGAPDLVLIPLAPATGRPVAVEMKRRKRSSPSEAQQSVHRLMRAAGWEVVVAYGADDAIACLRCLGYGVRMTREVTDVQPAATLGG